MSEKTKLTLQFNEIAVKRYHNAYNSDEFHHSRSSYSESVTDKSFFRPEISDVRSKLINLAGANVQGVYDFSDGKDTGDTIQTILRSKGLDRTEVDEMYRVIQETIERKKLEDKAAIEELQKANTRDEVNDAIKRIADSQHSSESPSE